MRSVQFTCHKKDFQVNKIGLFLILTIVALGSSSAPAAASSRTPLNPGHRLQASMDDGSLIDKVLWSWYISPMHKYFGILNAIGPIQIPWKGFLNEQDRPISDINNSCPWEFADTRRCFISHAIKPWPPITGVYGRWFSYWRGQCIAYARRTCSGFGTCGRPVNTNRMSFRWA